MSPSAGDDSDSDELDLETNTLPESSISFYSSVYSSSRESSEKPRVFYDRSLEDGVHIGIYKAILVRKVAHYPWQKELNNGSKLTLFFLETGGIRNDRRSSDNEDPRECKNRCAVQCHRVAVYPEWLGRIVMKNAVPGWCLPDSMVELFLEWKSTIWKSKKRKFWTLSFYAVVEVIWQERNNRVFSNKKLTAEDVAYKAKTLTAWWSQIWNRDSSYSTNDIVRCPDGVCG